MNLQQQVQNVAAQGRYGDSMLMHVNPAEVRGLAQVAPLTINPQTGQPEAFLPFLAPLIGSFLGPKLFGALGVKALTGGLGAALGSGLAQYAATGDAKKGLLAGLTGFGIGKGLESFANLAKGTAGAGQAIADASTGAIKAAGASAGSVIPTVGSAAQGAGQIAAGMPQTILQGATPLIPSIASSANAIPTGMSELINQSQKLSELKSAGALATPYDNLIRGFKDQGLGDIASNVTQSFSDPSALVPITIGAGQTSVLDSQELFADQMAQRDEEERQRQLANMNMYQEPILFNAGGMTNPRQEGIDEGVLMDANILAQSLMPATEQMMAEGGVTGYFQGGRPGIDSSDISPYARDMEEMYGGSNVQAFSGDMQRFSPARRAYDVNPNFMPGFQPETMYFAPNTINQKAVRTTRGEAPTFKDTFTGSKGGFNTPELSIAPQVAINPYEAFTSMPFQGLVTSPNIVPYPETVEATATDKPQDMDKSESMTNNLSPDMDTPKESVMDDISKLMDEMYSFADGGETDKKLPNKGLEALNKVAPDVVEKMGFQEGGSTDMMQDPIVQATIQFILGENDNQQVINDFIAKYGNEVFLQLRDRVLQSLVPGAQTEGLIEGNGQSGMADDIPGMIGANERVAVSQDEFIVPADVVSALGDGSSDAGSNELYKMMDRVRKEKTGDTTQPPRIDVDKVMPA